MRFGVPLFFANEKGAVFLFCTILIELNGKKRLHFSYEKGKMEKKMQKLFDGLFYKEGFICLTGMLIINV